MLAVAMRRTSRSTRAIAGVVVVAAVLAAVLVTGVASTDASTSGVKIKVIPVSGLVVDHTVTVGCPTSYCNEGVYTTGKVRGPFQFRLTQQTPTDVPGVFLYVGNGTLDTPRGKIECSDTGVLNENASAAAGPNPKGRGEGVHLCEIVGGTRYYKDATGYLQERFHFRGTNGGGDYQGIIRVRTKG